jgi:hypothetical protein
MAFHSNGFGGGGGGSKGFIEQFIGGAITVVQLINQFLSSAFGGFLIKQEIAKLDKQRLDEFYARLDEQVEERDAILGQLGLSKSSDVTFILNSQGSDQDKLSQLAALGNDPEAQKIVNSTTNFLSPNAGVAPEGRFDESGMLVRRDDAATPVGLDPFGSPPGALQGLEDISEEILGVAREQFTPEAAQARFDETLGVPQQGFQQLASQFAPQTAEIRNEFAGLQGAAGERLETARGIVSGLGGQERIDINRRFDELGASTQAGLRQRGLAGTTVTGSASSLVQEARSGALGRLRESLSRERLGVEQTFGGDVLRAQEAGALSQERSRAFGFGAQQASLLGRERLGGINLQTLDQASINFINTAIAAGDLPADFLLKSSQIALGSQPIFTPPQQQQNQFSTFPNFQT